MEKLAPGLQRYIEQFHIKSRVINGTKFLVFYKAVRSNYGSFFSSKFSGEMPYHPGNVVKVNYWSSDREQNCGPGLHVATAKWVASNYYYEHYIEVLVKPQDVVCVPKSAEKVRVKKLYVLREVSIRKDERSRVRVGPV
jgi:hypothetical protein